MTAEAAASSIEITEIADGVVAFVQPAGTMGRSNATAVIDGSEAFVVDTMLLPELAERVTRELDRRRVTPSVVLNSHPHVDHVGGNTAFPDARLLSLPATAAMATNLARDTSFLPRLFPEFADRIGALAITPPQPIAANQWDLPDGALALALGPAHSPGDLAVWLPKQRTLIAGDVCFNLVTPLALPGHTNLRGWINALDTLIALRPDTVVPGHGPVGTAATLDLVRGYLVDLLDAAGGVVAGTLNRKRAVEGLRQGAIAGWAEPDRTAANLTLAEAELTGGATDQRVVAPILRSAGTS